VYSDAIPQAQPMAPRGPDLSPKRLSRRRAAERRFRLYGLTAIAAALAMLVLLLATIVYQGSSAFVATEIALDVNFSAEAIDPAGRRDPAVLAEADYRALLTAALVARFPEANDRAGRRALNALVGEDSQHLLREMVQRDPGIIGQTRRVTLKASSNIDGLAKGFIDRSVVEDNRQVNDRQLAWFDALVADGRVTRHFNTDFLTEADSRAPEDAGILGALIGSLLTLAVTLALSFPLGVMAAIYLSLFAPKNRWTDLIEVNINNLAAVPSIVFGLLGLAVLLNTVGLPRSAPLAGGIVLALLTLPTIIIASRTAIEAVPPSIRAAALALGASPLQAALHHIVPLAMPGILTGTIIGMARALGESAPLLMIGMVAFIVDVPRTLTDAATVLPVQIFLWADAPERGFVEKTSGAIIILLLFLMAMNLAAILLRKRFERRW
jgi:phosphate transport system permease protein